MTGEVHPDNRVLLTCWKDIARYMGKGVRTVQRWERELGLPVRRPNGAEHKSAVAADPRDLDEWLESRWSLRGKVLKAGPRGGLPHVADTLETARILREAHSNLVNEVSTALQVLVQSCDRLTRRDESAK